MLGITVESVKNIVTAGSFAPLLVAFVVVAFVANKIVRTVSLLLAIGLGLAIFSQRGNIDECAKKISESADPSGESCDFFGYEFKLDLENPVSTGA